MIFVPQIRAAEPMKPHALRATLQKRLRSVTNCSEITTLCNAWWRNRLPPGTNLLQMNWSSPRRKPRSLASPPPKMSSLVAFIWILRAAAFRSSRRKARSRRSKEKFVMDESPLPAMARSIRFPCVRETLSKPATCLPKWLIFTKYACVHLWTNRKSARFGQTESVPKQVVPRGTRSVGELLCSVNNDKLELLPNVNVSVRINSQERSNVLVIPRGTVASEGGKRFVYVVKSTGLGVGKKILEKREIQLGIADSVHYQVVSGLDAKDLVALPGDVELHDGMRVKIINTESASLQGHQDVQ